MSNDDAEIRALIDRWAKAVHAGDMDGVLADHTEDIVMFDVPPPNEVRGKAAYRDTWPPFFNWQKQGAAFDLVSLDVVAGNDVAFAHALLRCGTAEELQRIREPPPSDHRPAQSQRPVGYRARASLVPVDIIEIASAGAAFRCKGMTPSLTARSSNRRARS